MCGLSVGYNIWSVEIAALHYTGMVKKNRKKAPVDQSLNHSTRDAIAYSVMTGMGESYFSAFALFLRCNIAQIGVLASLPPLLGSLAQLASAWLGHRTGWRKGIILFGATLQGLMVLPLMLLPLAYPEYAFAALLCCSVVYHFGSNFVVPQWTNLMGDLVPARRRGRYFGKRTSWATMSGFISLVIAGYILHIFDASGTTQVGFIIIFLIAAMARGVSLYHLAAMDDPPETRTVSQALHISSFFRHMRHTPAVRFSLFFATMQFSVSIAAPFFIVFMLRDLNFTYLEFMINHAMSVLVQFLTLRRWGRISDRVGNRFILGVCGLMIPLLPAFWLPSQNFWYLLIVQAFAGIVWAGYSLSASNFMYELVQPAQRPTYLAMHNVLTSLALFLGATVGGYLATHLPSQFSLFGHEFNIISPLIGVFVISTLARLTVALFLLPKVREVRDIAPGNVGNMIFRVARDYPFAGVIFDVITTGRRRRLKKYRTQPIVPSAVTYQEDTHTPPSLAQSRNNDPY